jgi:hypothetical protein
MKKNVELGLKSNARQWCKISGPLKGYKNGNIKGLSALGVMALGADPKIKDFLKKGLDEMEGALMPVTDKSMFKRRLTNQLVRSGSEIIIQGFEEWIIIQENRKINQLVNEYRSEGIVPFTSGGDSHIDFTVVSTSDSSKPGGVRKSLALYIQVTLTG